jgi:putative flippase GtrA
MANSRQLARFCAIGLLCFGLSTALLAALCELGHVYYLTAFVATFLVSCVVGYSLNGRYTFPGHAGFDGRALARYVAVNAVLLAINSIALPILVESFRAWYLAATVILAVLNIPVTFLAHRLLTYRSRSPSPLERSTWG